MPHYEALSYVWGSSEPRKDIFVSPSEKLVDSVASTSGRPSASERPSTFKDKAKSLFKKQRKLPAGASTLPLTADLMVALTYPRHEDKPRVLWIDAICINQSDNADAVLKSVSCTQFIPAPHVSLCGSVPQTRPVI